MLAGRTPQQPRHGRIGVAAVSRSQLLTDRPPQLGSAKQKKKTVQNWPKGLSCTAFPCLQKHASARGFLTPSGSLSKNAGRLPVSRRRRDTLEGASSRHRTQITATSLRCGTRCITRTTLTIITTSITGPALNHTQISLLKHFTTHPPCSARDRPTDNC